ncbi:guanine nucleotide releasing protein [Trypanosoma theileri]|uniref:Guanine nucleotide releasing protein n=1 Tax=Trypanosoma theileri TaxID=67003 RepID=A0A1X0P5W0_9TRYP|nr:guanine nucleotide releasing protein [Trypanosoma theileri]ORC91820.1 guanine nucleotide releasing protein [Trypanosoma theileri]
MVGASVESGQVRLYVRMEGFCPFALFVDEDMHRDAQEELARHYARDRYGPKADVDLVLVRCVLFTGNDLLMDFACVKRKQQKRLQAPLNAEALSAVNSKQSQLQEMKSKSTFINVLPVYQGSGSPEAVRESYRSKATSTLGSNHVVSREANDAALLMPSTTYLSFVAFHRLVLMMTDPRNPQRELYTRIFLLTYRQFVSPKELLDRILERYEVPLLTKSGESDRSPLEHQIFLELRRDIQFIVFWVLEFWVKNYYEDFADDTLYYHLER